MCLTEELFLYFLIKHQMNEEIYTYILFFRCCVWIDLLFLKGDILKYSQTYSNNGDRTSFRRYQRKTSVWKKFTTGIREKEKENLASSMG